MTFRSRKLLDLAEGQSCQNCNAQDGTVVAAHSNLLEHGRGHAHQSHDCYIAFLCWKCHSFLDHGGAGYDPTGIYAATKGEKEQMFRKAMDKTWLQLWEQELVKVA